MKRIYAGSRQYEMIAPPPMPTVRNIVKHISNRLYAKGLIDHGHRYYIISIQGYLFTTDYKPISPLDLDKMVHRLDGMGITVCIVEI